MLSIRIEEKRFPAIGRAEPRLVLQDLDFDVSEGELVCLIGPSGCGKTTTLNIVAGLDDDYRGSVRVAAGGRRRPRIGYVFQTPRLLPWRTVIENVRLVIPPEDGDSGISEELLTEVGLWDSRHFYPGRLSVGMQRRVALARAYAVSPQIMLMDEPFVSLDEATAQHLRILLLKLRERHPTTILLVTHDLREAIMLGDRLLILTSAPARVVGDVPIGIPRSERDPRTIDALRQTIVNDHQSVFAT